MLGRDPDRSAPGALQEALAQGVRGVRETEAMLARSLTEAAEAAEQCQKKEAELATLKAVVADKTTLLANLKKEIATCLDTCRQKGVVWKQFEIRR